MRSGMLINLERSEFPKGERAKPDGPSLSCALHRSRKAVGILVPDEPVTFCQPSLRRTCPSSVPLLSFHPSQTNRNACRSRRLLFSPASQKRCRPRPSLFSAAFCPGTFGSETVLLDLDAKKDGERVHRLPSCVMVKILE